MHVKPKKETIIEDGWYPAEIGEVEERETKFGEKLLVPFEVDAGEEGIIAIDAWLSLSDHPKSNLVKWAKQLLGDREFDTEELSGTKLEAFVEEGEGQDEEPKNFIRKVRPAKGANKPKKDEGEVTIDESDFNNLPL